MFSQAAVVGIAINRVRDALVRKISNIIIIVPATALTARPVAVLNQIHNLLVLDKFEYNPKKVQQITHENDLWHGMNLHKIKSEINPIPTQTWKNILPEKYAEELGERYSDINKLAL